MAIIKFTPENVAQVPNSPGLYALFGRAQNLLYVGTSQVLRHRLQSYYQIDDDHETKQELRPLVKYFYYEEMDLSEARAAEKEVKAKLEHNYK